LVTFSLALLAGCTGKQGRTTGEAPLAMEDSAHAHNERIRRSIEAGDSAGYMAEYADTVIALSDGEISGGRQAIAHGAGDALRSVRHWKASFSNEQALVLGPRAAAASLKFQLTGTDSTGKPVDLGGVWSGVLGIRNGRTVILQQHLSHPRAERP